MLEVLSIKREQQEHRTEEYKNLIRTLWLVFSKSWSILPANTI
jgi:hypothetical protein